MRAYRVWEHGDPSSVRMESVPEPCAAPGEIVVGVRAASINFPDTLVISGKYQLLPPRPFTPGKDLAGVVQSVGSGVSGFVAGDRVLAHVEHGAFAEQAIARPTQIFKIPDDMSFETAAAMGLVYQTAYFALVERGQLKKGETVLVGSAAGGVGLAAVQVAKALGAKVLAAVRSPQAADIVTRAGADAVIDFASHDPIESVRAQVRAHGDGADIVIDPLGGIFFAAALRAMAWCGRLIVVGFAAGEIPSAKANYLLLKNICVMGLQWSDYREREPEKVQNAQAHLFELWRRGAIKPRVARTFSFSELPAALDLVAKGEMHGKAVVTMESS